MKKTLFISFLLLILVIAGCAATDNNNEIIKDTTQTTQDTGVVSDLQDSDSLEQDLNTLEDIPTDDLDF